MPHLLLSRGNGYCPFFLQQQRMGLISCLFVPAESLLNAALACQLFFLSPLLSLSLSLSPTLAQSHYRSSIFKYAHLFLGCSEQRNKGASGSCLSLCVRLHVDDSLSLSAGCSLVNQFMKPFGGWHLAADVRLLAWGVRTLHSTTLCTFSWGFCPALGVELVLWLFCFETVVMEIHNKLCSLQLGENHRGFPHFDMFVLQLFFFSSHTYSTTKTYYVCI